MHRIQTTLQPQPRLAAQAAAGHTPRVSQVRVLLIASCFIGGCPSSVITTSLSSAVLLCMCVRCVERATKINTGAR